MKNQENHNLNEQKSIKKHAITKMKMLELSDKKCKATIIKMLQSPIASEKKNNEATT